MKSQELDQWPGDTSKTKMYNAVTSLLPTVNTKSYPLPFLNLTLVHKLQQKQTKVQSLRECWFSWELWGCGLDSMLLIIAGLVAGQVFSLEGVIDLAKKKFNICWINFTYIPFDNLIFCSIYVLHNRACHPCMTCKWRRLLLCMAWLVGW